MIAALYVDPVRGPYGRLPDVDVWGIERDADDGAVSTPRGERPTQDLYTMGR